MTKSRSSDRSKEMLFIAQDIVRQFDEVYQTLPLELKENKASKNFIQGIKLLGEAIKKFEESDPRLSTYLMGAVMALGAHPDAVDDLLDAQIQGMKILVERKLGITFSKEKGLNLFDSLDAVKPIDIRRL